MVKLTRLKDVRQRKALTQQQLADRAGVNRVTIARIEGGKDEPFPTTVRKVADALGVEPEELLEPAARAVQTPTNGPAADIRLDDRITVVDEQEVRRFLREEPDLIALIRETADLLSEVIPDARLRLRLLVDPEYGDETLFLGAATTLRCAEALEAIRRFDRAWGVDNMRRTRGLLIVDLE
jgi:transcriptional regulator with XRE-family HTH domain